jgi:uncharacterized protein YqfA (UPF0365 family)
MGSESLLKKNKVLEFIQQKIEGGKGYNGNLNMTRRGGEGVCSSVCWTSQQTSVLTNPKVLLKVGGGQVLFTYFSLKFQSFLGSTLPMP